MKIINNVSSDVIALHKNIDDACKNAHVMLPPKAFVNAKVFDANGKQTCEYISPSRSWTRNFYNLLIKILTGESNLSTAPGNGVLSLANQSGAVADSNYAAGNSSEGGIRAVTTAASPYVGINVGTGTAAESFGSYTMTRVANGSSAGQLVWGNQTTSIAWNNTTKKWTNTLSRVFNNNSGADIVVSEIGIFAHKLNYAIYNSQMISRDLLESALTVINGGSIAVAYLIEYALPE